MFFSSNYFQPMMLGMFGGNCSVSEGLLYPDHSALEPDSWNCTTLIPDNATIMMLDQEVELEVSNNTPSLILSETTSCLNLRVGCAVSG